MQKQEETIDSFVCPSFNSYSSGKLADIADRIIKASPQNEDADSFPSGNDFEFVSFRKDEDEDEIFLDGYVGPVYPIFNQDLLMEYESGSRNSAVDEEDDDVTELQIPMSKLFIGDDNQRFDRDPPSSSSSEVDDQDGIPPGTFCVWTPNSVKSPSPSPSASPSPSRCKKSRSTGSSSARRWKLLDLLRRSNSDGKESFVFLTPSSSASNLVKNKEVKSENSKEQWSSGSSESSKAAGKQKVKVSAVSGTGAVAGSGERKVSAHEAFYVRNRESRKLYKRRSYLPYRPDLVGFCASLNGMARAFAPL